MSNIQTLANLIAHVESSNDQFAVRFEPAHHPKPEFVEKLAKQCELSWNTAEVLCCMSFGLYQIMGDELISLGLNASPIFYCSSAPTQDFYFQKYLNANNINYSLEDVINDQAKRLHFATIYNGPGNPQGYAARMMEVYNQSKANQ